MKRGQLWFAAQFVLFCAILLVPFVGKFDEPLWLRALGGLILIGGIIVAVSGYRALGSNHSPWTNPIEGGQLVTIGSYRYCRHPIYTGLLIVTLGWALVLHSWFGLAVTVAGVVFYDLKSREEEKWLKKKYSDYPSYQRRVKRFVPGLY